jgi:hypothetical protein
MWPGRFATSTSPPRLFRRLIVLLCSSRSQYIFDKNPSSLRLRPFHPSWYSAVIFSGRNSSPLWACGAVGSALPWHGRGQGFESLQVHQSQSIRSRPPVSAIGSCRFSARGLFAALSPKCPMKHLQRLQRHHAHGKSPAQKPLVTTIVVHPESPGKLPVRDIAGV